VIGRIAAALPLAASTKHSSSQKILKHRLMECLQHQTQMMPSPTGDDGDNDQDGRTGDAEAGRSGSTHRPIPTHFQWNLVIDRRTMGDLRPQDIQPSHCASGAVSTCSGNAASTYAPGSSAEWENATLFSAQKGSSGSCAPLDVFG
jgi:hypothetical protein